MENIISLLWDKTHHLQRFYEINESELMNFVEGNFDNLEVFYNSREAILDLVACIDRLIEQANISNPNADATNEQKQEISSAIARKNDLVNEILAQDLQILSVLESAKSNIIKELSQVRAARKAVGAYGRRRKNDRLDEEM